VECLRHITNLDHHVHVKLMNACAPHVKAGAPLY
jgi:hypothetical protein